MDGLALLCNLFADGPVTLRRLRAAGVRDLTDLQRAEPATLGAWLHASVPHARQFAVEAERLARRLAEPVEPRAEARRPVPEATTVRPAAPPSPQPVSFGRAHGQPLRPGLFPGLDEATCMRLQAQQVYTTRTLIEFTSLSLARRTGIPYSSLLDLARRARRLATGEACTGDPVPGAAPAPRAATNPGLTAAPAPFAALRAPEPARTDEFSLPPVEPESAGPFV
jgi:hypothetical protein